MKRFRCVEGCSDCCINREYYPDKKYGKIGVLVLPSEKEGIEQFARKLGKTIKILPRIGVGSKFRKGGRIGPKNIIAYQLMGVNRDGDLCPFLDRNSDERSPHGGYICRIYEHRPLACRAYPLIESKKELILDDKCRFCDSCSDKINGLVNEKEALANITQEVSSNEKDIWRYATGVCDQEDKDLVRKGWILDTN